MIDYDNASVEEIWNHEYSDNLEKIYSIDNRTGKCIDNRTGKYYYIGAPGFNAIFYLKDGEHHRLDGPAVIFQDGYQEWYVNGQYHRLDGPAILNPNGTKKWYYKGKIPKCTRIPTEMQICMVMDDPENIKQLSFISNKVQKLIQLQYPEYVKYIPNPIPKPKYMSKQKSTSKQKLKIDYDNATPEEIWNYEYSDDLEKIDNYDNKTGKTGKFYMKKWNAVVYLKNGQLHRLDGPAVIYFNKIQEWWVNGKLHRLDGPAVIWPNGYRAWLFNSKLHRLNGPARIKSNGKKEYWIDNKQLNGKIPAPKSLQEYITRHDPDNIKLIPNLAKQESSGNMKNKHDSKKIYEINDSDLVIEIDGLDHEKHGNLQITINNSLKIKVKSNKENSKL